MSEKWWVPHKELVFTPAFVCNEADGKVSYKCDTGEILDLKTEDTNSLGIVSDEHLMGIGNIVTMETVSPGAILETLRKRYITHQKIHFSVCRLLRLVFLGIARLSGCIECNRYSKDQIYSNVSSIVIAVNPFQMLNIYTSEIVDIYAKAADTTELEPHIYSVLIVVHENVIRI